MACQIVDALHPGSIAFSKVCTEVCFERRGRVLQSRHACKRARPLLDAKSTNCRFQTFWVLHVIHRYGNGAAAGRLHTCVHIQVKFNANTEYEMINNYKILQNAFNKMSIAKVRLYGPTCCMTLLYCLQKMECQADPSGPGKMLAKSTARV